MFTVCDLKDEDISRCLEIYNYYIRTTTYSFEEEELGIEDFTKRVKGIIRSYPFIVVKNDEGIVVGYAYLDKYGQRSAYRYTADLSIYIDHLMTHNHLGPLLLDEIIKRGKEQGIKNIVSIITGENTASMRFHEKNGFILEGRLKDIGFKFGRWLDVAYYRKKISED